MVKRGKRILALALSACMIMGSAITTFADDSATGTGPIYSFDLTQVVVPTNLTVAFNPEGLTVNVGTGTSTDQVLSQGIGIINKSNKDKTVQVAFKASDLNTDKITFASSADEVTNAEKDSYVLYLTAVPATTFSLASGAVDKDTAVADLANVTMTGDEAKAVAIADEGVLGFCLGKATYSPKSGSEVTLGTTTTNDVQSNYELSAIDSTNGLAAFKFSGAMNTNTTWSALTDGVKIDVTYTFEDVAEATPTYGIVDVVSVVEDGDTVKSKLGDTDVTFKVNPPAADATVTYAGFDLNNSRKVATVAQDSFPEITLSGQTVTYMLTESNNMAGTYTLYLVFSDNTTYTLDWVIE